MRALFFAFALASVLAGCVGSADELIESGETHEAIINGTRDTGHAAVVLLDVGPAGLCTGTVIYPLTILTAAHCTYPARNGMVNVYVNDDYAQGRRPSATSTHVTWDSLFNPSSLDRHDVGLVLLDSPIPNITPIPLYTGTQLASGGVGLMVGYGATSTARSNSNHSKYYGFIPIVEYNNGEYWDGGTWMQGAGATTTCFGDSGGPLLSWLGAPLSVAAVLSSGIGSCSDPAAYPDILPETNWINLTSYSWALQH